MPRVLKLSLILLTLTVSVAVGGCGSVDPPPDQATSDEMRTDPQHSGSPTPRPLPTASRATSKAHRLTAAASGKDPKIAPALPGQRGLAIDAHLLADNRMPKLADDFAWAVQSDGPESPPPPGSPENTGACQKTSLEAIGALSAVRRIYSSGEGLARASQVVGRFADTKSAWRANEVLEAWREDCEERLDYSRTAVGPMQQVPVDAGIGSNYAMAYGPRSAAKGWVAGLGILRWGRFVSIVEISTGPDQYPSGWDPARAAVRRIARTFA